MVHWTGTRPPAGESVGSCGIQHGPIMQDELEQDEHALSKSHRFSGAMCSLGPELGGVDR